MQVGLATWLGGDNDLKMWHVKFSICRNEYNKQCVSYLFKSDFSCCCFTFKYRIGTHTVSFFFFFGYIQYVTHLICLSTPIFRRKKLRQIEMRMKYYWRLMINIITTILLYARFGKNVSMYSLVSSILLAILSFANQKLGKYFGRESTNLLDAFDTCDSDCDSRHIIMTNSFSSIIYKEQWNCL